MHRGCYIQKPVRNDLVRNLVRTETHQFLGECAMPIFEAFLRLATGLVQERPIFEIH